LTGKYSPARGRGLRGRWTGFLGAGSGCFQTVFGPFPGGRGMSQGGARAPLAKTCKPQSVHRAGAGLGRSRQCASVKKDHMHDDQTTSLFDFRTADYGGCAAARLHSFCPRAAFLPPQIAPFLHRFCTEFSRAPGAAVVPQSLASTQRQRGAILPAFQVRN